MAQKIKIGAVSYLNTKPLIYGLQQGLLKDEAELQIDFPAAIAGQLINGTIDIGLIPAAAIPLVKDAAIVTDFCIGCNGEVASVALFSDVPVNEVKTVLLDYQSKTSVALLKILLKEHWKIAVDFTEGYPGYEKQITGTTAGLVIGDRAFNQAKKSKYKYDLGLVWKEMTGLPFVFAAWVTNKQLPKTFIQAFNEANVVGLEHIDEVIKQNPTNLVDLKKYYTENLQYYFDEEKKKAMQLFLGKI